MSEPDDKILLEFVAKFAGWTEMRESKSYPGRTAGKRGDEIYVPDYLHSVDAWLRDVAPRIEATMNDSDIATQATWFKWGKHLIEIVGLTTHGLANADARSRCLALWRALDGKLPEENKNA